MFLKIDSKSGIPIYLQIVEQIKWQVASGRLLQGDRVPTVRELAISLRINPNTVAKSYRELEREGILEGRTGQGSFISGSDSGLSLQKKLQIVSRSMEPPLVQAYHLQLETAKVRDVFERKLVEIYREDSSVKGDCHE